jgi:alkylation response protein AidB-like acyl-CoA dehydrogenase
MFAIDASEETSAVVDVCRALGRELDAAAAASERRAGLPPSLRDAVTATGLVGAVSERHGGDGVPATRTQLVALEELAAGDPALAMAVAWSRSGAAFLDHAQLLGAVEPATGAPPTLRSILADRAATVPVAVFEGFGRAPSESHTRLGPVGDGRCTVTGTKVAVAAPDGADALVVIGTTANGVLGAALVQSDALRDASQVSIRTPQRIALGAARLSEVRFDAAAALELSLPQSTLVRLVAQHRLLGAAAMLGTARRSLEYAVAYANERIAFGRPISSFQGVSFLLADDAIRLAAARLDLHTLADAIDPSTGNAEDSQDGGSDVEGRTTTTVNYCAAVATEATRNAIQVLGGHGFITDHPVERWYRSAIALGVIDTDPLAQPYSPAL